jgi:hypothetical protein
MMNLTSNFDMTKLGYEKINDMYSKAKYLEIECVMDTQSGYINATKFCSVASGGKKMIEDYLRSNRYKDLIAEYTEGRSDQIAKLSFEVITDVNELCGIYINPDLLFDLACWVSPTAYKRASAIVMNASVSENYNVRTMMRDEDVENKFTNQEHYLLTPDLTKYEQSELETKVLYLVNNSACAHCTHLCTHDMHKERFNTIQTLSLHKDKRSFFEIINEKYRENQNAEKARIDRVAELDALRSADQSMMYRY